MQRRIPHPISLADNMLGLRQKVYGCPRGKLEWLTTLPKAVVAYARKTLVDLDV